MVRVNLAGVSRARVNMVLRRDGRPRRAAGPGPRAAALAGTVLAGVALVGCSASTAPDGTKAAPVAVTTGFSVVLPDVVGATALGKEPRIDAGTGTPPPVLLTNDLVVGKGDPATATSTVAVHYVGTLWNGTKFDSSWTSGQPVALALGGNIIPGFTKGIAGMRVGGRREISIPPDLGYGASGSGPVPANATLEFVVDLLAIKPAGQ